MGKPHLLSVHMHQMVFDNILHHVARVRAAGHQQRALGALIGTKESARAVALHNLELSVCIPESTLPLALDAAFLQQLLLEQLAWYPGYDVLGWYTAGTAPQGIDQDMHKVFQQASDSAAPLCMLVDPMKHNWGPPDPKVVKVFNIYERFARTCWTEVPCGIQTWQSAPPPMSQFSAAGAAVTSGDWWTARHRHQGNRWDRVKSAWPSHDAVGGRSKNAAGRENWAQSFPPQPSAQWCGEPAGIAVVKASRWRNAGDSSKEAPAGSSWEDGSRPTTKTRGLVAAYPHPPAPPPQAPAPKTQSGQRPVSSVEYVFAREQPALQTPSYGPKSFRALPMPPAQQHSGPLRCYGSPAGSVLREARLGSKAHGKKIIYMDEDEEPEPFPVVTLYLPSLCSRPDFVSLCEALEFRPQANARRQYLCDLICTADPSRTSAREVTSRKQKLFEMDAAMQQGQDIRAQLDEILNAAFVTV